MTLIVADRGDDTATEAVPGGNASDELLVDFGGITLFFLSLYPIRLCEEKKNRSYYLSSFQLLFFPYFNKVQKL